VGLRQLAHGFLRCRQTGICFLPVLFNLEQLELLLTLLDCTHPRHVLVDELSLLHQEDAVIGVGLYLEGRQIVAQKGAQGLDRRVGGFDQRRKSMPTLSSAGAAAAANEDMPLL